jgi:hypothetical protein
MLHPFSAQNFNQEYFSVRQKSLQVQYRAGSGRRRLLSGLRRQIPHSGGAVAKW